MSMASRTAYSTWTPQKLTLFDGHYLRNRSTLDIGVLGSIGIVQHKEHSPEVLSIPPGTPVYSGRSYILQTKVVTMVNGKSFNKVKVKFTLEQATKAQKGRSIALLFP